MADLTLDTGQYQIGNVAFGRRTAVEVTNFTYSEPAATASDLALPGEDGVSMGRDYLQGRTFTWEMVVNGVSPADGRAKWRPLETAWDARTTRLTPGAVTPLRLRLPGTDTVVVYGRPRKIAPSDLQFLRSGAIPLTADFSSVDRFFYADEEQEVSFGVRPTIGSGGGITWPITWPITWASADISNSDVVVNGGDAPTWPVITFTGPIVNPTIVVGDNLHTLQLVTTLSDSQSVTIDCRPWARTITRDDGGSLAGTQRGSRMADLILMPGSTLISIQGIDLDGTASGRIRWRNAYSTI